MKILRLAQGSPTSWHFLLPMQWSCFHRWSHRLRHTGPGDARRGESISGACPAGHCGQMPDVGLFERKCYSFQGMELVVYLMKFPCFCFHEVFVLLAFWWSMFIFSHKTFPGKRCLWIGSLFWWIPIWLMHCSTVSELNCHCPHLKRNCSKLKVKPTTFPGYTMLNHLPLFLMNPLFFRTGTTIFS